LEKRKWSKENRFQRPKAAGKDNMNSDWHRAERGAASVFFVNFLF